MAGVRASLAFGLVIATATATLRFDHSAADHEPVLELRNARGDVVLTATEVTVTTASGTFALDDAELEQAVVMQTADNGTTVVSVTPRAPGVTNVVVRFTAGDDERFFGLGERATGVDHRGTSVVNRVADGPWTEAQLDVIRQVVPAAGFSDRSDSTYFPVPWVLSTEGFGVLVDGHDTSRFDLATDADPSGWTVDVSAPDLHLRVFTGATPLDTLARMTAAVGRQPEPIAPWLFGPWWQAAGDESAELDALVATGVPMSVAQTYTHYLPCADHAGREAEERERVDRLHDAGLAVTTYVNPMVCVGNRDVYMPGSLTGAFTLDAAGMPYRYRYFTTTFFDVVQFDFSSPAGVQLFHAVLDDVVANGYDGWMEDFGEYTPDDAVSADGTPGPAMHNRYPELYHAAAWSYAESAPRPLVRFNRSGWTGAIGASQVVWGGDPTTTWGFDGLQSAVYSGLGMGLSGVSLWGSDIGGFFTFEGEQPTPELLSRWIELGAFSPVMRLQAGGVSLVDEEPPTVVDAGVLDDWRRYSQLRTRLYPYIAGSQDAYEATGMPLMRHMALVAPEDPVLTALDDQYLFGADLLVAPVIVPGAERRAVFLPPGDWIEWWRSVTVASDGSITLGAAQRHPGDRSEIVGAPLGEIPLFVRSGAVIPLLPADVKTLADYGRDGVVRLTDRDDRRTLLAFPGGDWSGPLGPGETMASSTDGPGWTLRLDGATARTYDVQASMEGLPDETVPCAVAVDGADVAFAFDAATRVLTTSVEIGPTGELTVAAC